MQVIGAIVPGHGVASGKNGDTRFPGGTVAMQMPVFAKLGLDLSAMHPGTLNVKIAPAAYRLVRPRVTFPLVKWHPVEPAETFSFIDCRLIVEQRPPVAGFIYHPHPETKPEHFQAPDVIELLMPLIPGLRYGMRVTIEASEEQIVFLGSECSPAAP